MKFLKKIGNIFKKKNDSLTHPKDARLEQMVSESALVEIELRDR